MGKKVSVKTGGSSMTIRLSDLGMTALHKVGLAGLWMTLKTFEKDTATQKRLLKAGGEWSLARDSISLSWTGDWKKFFAALFEESFKLHKGLLWFPALGNPFDHIENAVVMQDAVLNTILQHGKSRKAEKGEGSGAVAVEIDGITLPLRYKKITQYGHQDAKSFTAAKKNTLAGWLLPGGAVRHVGLGQDISALEEPPERALVLRYLCVGAVYFQIHSIGRGTRPRYAIVLPEITDCEAYSQARQLFLKQGVQQLKASGSAEAGLRLLSELRAANLLPKLLSAFCRVISFGIVPWSTQQKSRVEVLLVKPSSERAFRIFRICSQYFAPRFVVPKQANKTQQARKTAGAGAKSTKAKPDPQPFWSVPQMPDLVAQNLTAQRPWWMGFADYIAEPDRGKQIFKYERKGLQNMVENKEALPTGPERAFVQACHEAWRRQMGALGERTRKEGTSFADKAQKEFDKLRVSFSRCKTAASFRETLMDFWSKAGSLPSLQAGWREVMALLNDDNWKKGKDLALLAMASYKPATKDEEAVFSVEDNSKPRGQ